MATVNMSIRMDTELKKQAEIMLADMGLNMTTAMNMFLRQVVRQGRIPFDIATSIPNGETIAAIKEMEDIMKNTDSVKVYANSDELFEELNNEV